MDISAKLYNNKKFDFLRPGSLIHYFAEKNPITGSDRWNVIEVDQKLLDRFKKTFDYDGPYRPIFLNDYWMGRFGFEESGDYYRLPGVKILRDARMLIPLGVHRVSLNFVHELQNLYREQTHTELSLPIEHLSAPYWNKRRPR